MKKQWGRTWFWVAAFMLFVSMTGCGGSGGNSEGGGGTSPQAIAFETAGDLYKVAGDVAFINRAIGGKGSGAVNYVSSDTAIAVINTATSEVNPVKQGVATITAVKEADATYAEATASYTLYVAPESIPFTAYIGTDDAVVTFPDDVAGVTFERTTELNCPPGSFITCANGESDVLGTEAVVDPAATLLAPAWYMLRYGDLLSRVATISFGDLPERVWHQTVSHDGKLWVVGGNDADGNRTNDVWASTDGKAWVQVTPSAGFSRRAFHQTVSFKGKLWLMGGSLESDEYDAGVWNSADGKTWEKVFEHPKFDGLAGHQMVVFNGRIWVIGGASGPEAKNDIWWSEDGLDWTEVKDSSGRFSPRTDHSVVVYGDNLWLIGGVGQAMDYKNDVWVSADGFKWSKVSGTLPPLTGLYQNVVAHGGRLWLYGGMTSPDKYNTYVYSSTDGITWRKEGLFSKDPVAGFSVTRHAGRMWDIGGMVGPGSAKAPRSSADGITWHVEKVQPDYGERLGHATLLFDNTLWMVGGQKRGEVLNDVQRSSDGTSWDLVTDAPEFPARVDFGATVFGGKMWVVGGGMAPEPLTPLNDVWFSADGSTWESVPPSPRFTPRVGHALVAFDGKLWVIGGDSGGLDLNDVWSSEDGMTWVPQGNGPFSPRHGHQAMVFDGKLWVMGGGLSTDCWNTTDGTSWTPVPDPPFLPRFDYAMAVFQGKLYAVAGYAGSQKNDIWRTDDGLAWEKVDGTMPFAPREALSLVVHGDTLILSGGRVGPEEVGDVWVTKDGETWRRAFASEIRLR